MAITENISDTGRQYANEITNYPQYCNKNGCGKDADVAVMIVRDATGKLNSGAFSDFGYVKRQGESVKYLLRSGYTFVTWATRCAECYLIDIDRAGKAAIRLPSTQYQYPPKNEQERQEYIEVIKAKVREIGR